MSAKCGREAGERGVRIASTDGAVIDIRSHSMDRV